VKLQADEKKKTFEKTESYLKNIETIGQLVGEVLQKITEEKIMVKAASGPRYVVGCRPKIDKNKLKPGVRVTLDMTTYTIMRILPREVDPNVHNMLAEDPGNIKYSDVGGLTN
jgi:26S proteasome regulatory subunit T4